MPRARQEVAKFVTVAVTPMPQDLRRGPGGVGMAAPKVAAASGRCVEDQLAELARSAGPLRRVVAALAGRLVERKSWGRLGYARLGDYARERLGVSGRSLQEFAKVDRALAERPRLEAALVSGRLPWSTVRLLARFVTAEDEARWIERATQVGVRVLERECRAVDRGAVLSDEEGGDTEPSEWVRLRAPRASPSSGGALCAMPRRWPASGSRRARCSRW